MYIKTSNQPRLKLGFRDYECNWGVHIAGLYETKKERDEILFGYLSQGCLDDDLQLYAPTEWTKEEFGHSFSQQYPNCKHCLHTPDHFQIFSAKALYYPDGKFSVFAMDRGLDAFYVESQKNGPRNVRATAEMVWALEAIPGVEYLMAYEARLNFFIPGKPWISICLYNINKFSGAIIMDVLRTHPFVINRGVFTENPYFQDPKKWLETNAPQFLRGDE